ncbi:MAG: 30S ribosomal protein S6 [Phycisphaerales bacterium]
MTQTATKNVYEVMFLVNQAVAADLSSLVDHINEVLSRAGAEVISMRKWDERRLAYPIEKQKRGVYFLAYVALGGEGPTKIERDVVISEKIMRVLITKADHLTEEEMKTHDKRDELAAEAKLRAEQGGGADEKRSTISVGAPVQDQAPDDASDEDEGSDDDSEDTDD